ncbi:hypothetical protein ONO23_01289 [Micromonospora noduli]|uniref:PIN-like domain-containing protein n=1 Tax=Micromonospora noduli TaxID=709876 RepID=UPI000DBFD53C|nr:PIN-like domain-containing protein [Micromonospora noduli]RAO37099.1 hypothetical protein ONO23_01289 [Micromonospora noduli]
MTKGFSTAFTHFLLPSDETVRVALTSGLIVLDTNVLLSAYRFAAKAREELLSTLQGVADRVWVPYQVGLEFHRNRPAVMAERRGIYEALLNDIKPHQESIQSELEGKLLHLSNRAALTEDERDGLLTQLRQVFEPLRGSIVRLSNDHAPEGKAEDTVLARLQQIVGDRIGDNFDKTNEADARAEAERRAKDKIPPGFKDAAKPGGGYGDYYLWRQTLDEAKRRSITHLVLVTGDKKEDWYLRVRGETVSALPALTDELHRFCGAQLVLMDTQTLLVRAKQYLNADVSSETIRQAGQLPEAESVLEASIVLRRRGNDFAELLEELEREIHQVHLATTNARDLSHHLKRQQEQAADQSEKKRYDRLIGRAEAMAEMHESRLADLLLRRDSLLRDRDDD